MVQSILLASSKPSPTPPPSDSLPASQGGFSLPSSQEAWPSSQTDSLTPGWARGVCIVSLTQGSCLYHSGYVYMCVLAGLEGRVLSPSLRAHVYITLGSVLAGLEGCVLSPSLRAHAYITLGMCICVSWLG